jgi:hypothetical protein
MLFSSLRRLLLGPTGKLSVAECHASLDVTCVVLLHSKLCPCEQDTVYAEGEYRQIAVC